VAERRWGALAPDVNTMINPNDTKRLTPKTAFAFSCTQCGECCFDQLVLLDPFDLFYLSRFGDLPHTKTTIDLFTNGYVELLPIDEELRCALVMPKFQRGTKCRFLTPELNEQGKLLRWFCELHQKGAKPLVCISSPIARDLEGHFYLVAPVDTCPGMKQGEPEELQDYIKRLQISERLEAALQFYQALRKRPMSEEEVFCLYNFDQEGALTQIEEVADYLENLWSAGCSIEGAATIAK
jgi:hypothetical protein